MNCNARLRSVPTHTDKGPEPPVPGRARLCAVTTLGVLATLAGGGVALAQDTATQGWSYEVTPYLWGSGLSGTISPGASAPDVDVDASFSDLVDQLDIGLFVGGTATNGDFALFGDLQYIRLEFSEPTPGPLVGTIDGESTLTALTAGAEYLVVNTPEARLSVAGGLRYWDVDIDLRAGGGVLPGGAVSGGDDWVDGMVGLRGSAAFSGGWFGTGWALVGGGGSDFASDVFAGVGYQFSDLISLIGGYRYLSVDRNDGGFVYDVEQSGALLGLRFSF